MDKIEQLRAKLIRAGFSPQEVQDYIAKQHPGLKDELLGGAADVLQGASLGLAGVADSDLKQRAEGFNKRHSVLGPVANIGGSVLGAMAMPAAWGAGMLGRTLVGAGAGAIQGATADGTPEQRLKRAAVGGAVGGAAGAILPPVAGFLGRGARRFVAPLRKTENIVADAGAMLPDNAEAIMARQEQLAPGTSVPATLDSGLPKSVRVMGANPRMAREAAGASMERATKLQAAKDAMRPKYQALLQGKRAPLDLGEGAPNIRKIVINNGMWPGDETIELEAVQTLRDALDQKIETLAIKSGKGRGGGTVMHKLNEQKKALTKWLETTAPGISKLDKDYGVLSRAKRAEESITKNLQASRAGYTASRVAGFEPGSPAAAIPSKGGFLHGLIHPDRAKLAEAANRLLLQPGQISQELLKARARAAAPGGQFNLLMPYLSGAAAGRGTGLLDF